MLDSILSKEDLKRLSSAWNITSGTDLYHDIARQIEAAVLQHLKLQEQMEAYAAAKVREALEEAAQVCDTYFKEIEEQSRSTYQEGALDAADILEQRIRALIPSTPA